MIEHCFLAQTSCQYTVGIILILLPMYFKYTFPIQAHFYSIAFTCKIIVLLLLQINYNDIF